MGCDAYGLLISRRYRSSAVPYLFPAAVPRYAFATWPVFPDIASLNAEASLLPPEIIRNCMPSLHTTWALLIVMNTRTLSPWPRHSAVVFAILTLIATLVSGEHYLIDLVVAVPFAVTVQSVARLSVGLPCRWFALWFGSACVAAWFYVLVVQVSWLLTIPGLTLVASILTVFFSAVAASWRAKVPVEAHTASGGIEGRVTPQALLFSTNCNHQADVPS